MQSQMLDLKNNYYEILKSISNANSNVKPQHEVQLIAVSKTFAIDKIITLYELGQKNFGESYALEFYNKAQSLKELKIKWHFIGPLQSNKIKFIAPYANWVHSIEKKAHVDKLSKLRPNSLTKLNALIQIKINDSATQHGIDIKNTAEILELATIINSTPNMIFRGFMGIASNSQDSLKIENEFILLNKLFYMIKSGKFKDIDTLSIGMSNDYLSAIKCGATHIRIGSKLFGKR